MSQIDGKWIKDNAVEDNHVRLRNDQCLRGRNAGNTADIDMIKVNSSNAVEFCAQPKWGTAPVANDDLTNKAYVLDVLAGLRDPKDAVKVASTFANIDLVTGGLLTIDGVVLGAGDRVLVKDQTDPAENGIYLAAAGAWTRSLDADDISEINQGMSCLVSEGLTNARKQYVMTSDPVTLGVDPIDFAQVPNPANFLVPQSYTYTLVAGDITNGYIELPHQAEAGSVIVTVYGGPMQKLNDDYTISTPAFLTRITFAGTLAPLLAAGDELLINYSYATS